jgi:HD-GYP domain-containing protein (c-di-GMP phosphodiesterase class II)
VRSIIYSIERNRVLSELKKSREELLSGVKKLNDISNGVIVALEETVELRDPYTAGHQRRVAELSVAIAVKMGVPAEQIMAINLAALVHDIGKIYVPVEILVKPGKLTETEYEIIMRHPGAGYDLLKPIPFPWPIEKMVLQHHERADGSGYPSGLLLRDILPEARIIAVADVIEAMCNDRPYRKAPGREKALEEIFANRGKKYFPDAVDACLELFRKDNFSFSA